MVAGLVTVITVPCEIFLHLGSRQRNGRLSCTGRLPFRLFLFAPPYNPFACGQPCRNYRTFARLNSYVALQQLMYRVSRLILPHDQGLNRTDPQRDKILEPLLIRDDISHANVPSACELPMPDHA